VLRLDAVTDAYRLVHSEADGLSGLVVDRFGDTLVLEFFAAGMFRQRSAIMDALKGHFPGANFYWFAEEHVGKQESFDCRSPEPPPPGVITEHGLKFRVAPGSKHKTGFFVDQRDNRKTLADFCRGKRVLDLCCNTGGFGGLRQGPRRGGRGDRPRSRRAGARAGEAEREAQRGGDPLRAGRPVRLAAGRDPQRERFDVVVLDPAKLTRDRESVDQALRKYCDMNRLALQVVAPGGIFLTCSCTGLVREEDFLEIGAPGGVAGRPHAAGVQGGRGRPGPPIPAERPGGPVSEGGVLPGGIARTSPHRTASLIRQPPTDRRGIHATLLHRGISLQRLTCDQQPRELAAVGLFSPGATRAFPLEAPITPVVAMNEPPHPVLLNTWKHHAGWIRWRIGEAVAAGQVDVLPQEMVVIGNRLMDLYTGPLTPAVIGEHVVERLRARGRLEFEPLSAWLQGKGQYALIELPDGSKWTVRLGPPEGRYLHLHPGRWAPNTMRVQANTLKSAVVTHAHALLAGGCPTDLAVVNEARRKYLGLLPVRELTGDGGLGAAIAALGERGA
jgi:hypothetical protein